VDDTSGSVDEVTGTEDAAGTDDNVVIVSVRVVVTTTLVCRSEEEAPTV